MPTLSDITIFRLRAVTQAMLSEPQLVDMQCDRKPLRATGGKSCGSPGCIFGWANLLFGERDSHCSGLSAYEDGAVALGLPKPTPQSWMTAFAAARTPADGLSARLYFPENWPTTFRDDYNTNREAWYSCTEAQSSDRRDVKLAMIRCTEALIVARRIAHYISTDGAE